MWKLKTDENYSNVNPSEVPRPETHEYSTHSIAIKVEYILHVLYFDDFVKTIKFNTIRFNSKVAHGRSHCKTTKYRIHTKYRSLLGKVTRNSENNITAI